MWPFKKSLVSQALELSEGILSWVARIEGHVNIIKDTTVAINDKMDELINAKTGLEEAQAVLKRTLKALRG